MVRGEHIEFTVPERFNLGAYYLDGNLDAGRGDAAIHYQDKTYRPGLGAYRRGE